MEDIDRLEKELVKQRDKIDQMRTVNRHIATAMKAHADTFSLWKRESRKLHQQQQSKLKMVQRVKSVNTPHIPASTPTADTTPFPPDKKKGKKAKKCSSAFPLTCGAAETLHSTAPPALSPESTQLYPSLPPLDQPLPYDLKSLARTKAKNPKRNSHNPFWNMGTTDDDSFQGYG